MSLEKVLALSASNSIVKEEVSEQRLKNNIITLRNEIAFFREYPDIFVDTIKGPDCTFNFRFTQRIFLRAVMRHRYVYATFTRGKQKSLCSF